MLTDILTIDQNDELVYEFSQSSLNAPDDILFNYPLCYELVLYSEKIVIFGNS